MTDRVEDEYVRGIDQLAIGKRQWAKNIGLPIAHCQLLTLRPGWEKTANPTITLNTRFNSSVQSTLYTCDEGV